MENSININAFSYIYPWGSQTNLDKLIKLNKSSKFSFKNVECFCRLETNFCKTAFKNCRKLDVISDIISLNCDLVILGGEYQVFKTAMLPLINHIVKENAYPVEVVPCMQYPGIYGLFALSYELIEQLVNVSTEKQ